MRIDEHIVGIPGCSTFPFRVGESRATKGLVFSELIGGRAIRHLFPDFPDFETSWRTESFV